MSVIMVSKTHIDALLTAALRWMDPVVPLSFYREEALPGGVVMQTPLALTAENAHELGRAIWLYHFEQAGWDDGLSDVAAYAFDELPGEPDPVVILWGIAFYEYQTAPEAVEEWSDTVAYRFVTDLRDMAISRLPDIERVPWGLDDRDIFLRWAARSRPPA
jgi:hypothetical protein